MPLQQMPSLDQAVSWILPLYHLLVDTTRAGLLYEETLLDQVKGRHAMSSTS